MVNVWPHACYCHGLALDLTTSTVDTSMITVSSCGVILQSGWERTLGMHMHFVDFHSFIFFPFHMRFYARFCVKQFDTHCTPKKNIAVMETVYRDAFVIGRR